MSTHGRGLLQFFRWFVLITLGFAFVFAVGYSGSRLKCPIRKKQLEMLDDIARQQHQTETFRQTQEVAKGNIDCLVNPDPSSLDKLVANLDCRRNLTTVYMGRDVSDPRLARLRNLPNLKSVIFFWTENPAIFLEHLKGKASIEAVSYDRTLVSRRDGQILAGLPNLKSLCLPMQQSALECLRSNCSIEALVLTNASADEQLISIVQSMPKLRHLAIHTYDSPEKASEFEGLLRQAVPECECSVISWWGKS